MARKRRSNKATDINNYTENLIFEPAPDGGQFIDPDMLDIQIPISDIKPIEPVEPEMPIHNDPTPEPEPEPVTPDDPNLQILYVVKITVPKLYMRGGPGYNYPTYGILEGYPILNIYQEKNEFGLLDNGHWIALQYTEKI